MECGSSCDAPDLCDILGQGSGAMLTAYDLNPFDRYDQPLRSYLPCVINQGGSKGCV